MERLIAQVQGYDIDLMTFDDAVNYVTDNISNKQGMHIITINPEMIELANKNKCFKEILKEADLVVPDGVGITIALKLKNIEQEQIPGIDLAVELIKNCAITGDKISLIGAKEKILQKAAENIEKEFIKLNICYKHNGYFTTEKEKEIINNLTEKSPSLVLVALGAPKQEIFINKCRETLPYTVFIGVGGAFDVWAGEVERAPEIYRNLGLEWLYRTIKQPERFKRIYKTLPIFLFKAIIEAIRNKCLKGNK